MNRGDYLAAATPRFSGLEHPVVNTMTCDVGHPEESKALGRHINATVEAERSRRVEEIESAPVANRLAEAHGLGSSVDALAPVRKSEMSDRERELRERLASKRSGTPTITTT